MSNLAELDGAVVSTCPGQDRPPHRRAEEGAVRRPDPPWARVLALDRRRMCARPREGSGRPAAPFIYAPDSRHQRSWKEQHA